MSLKVTHVTGSVNTSLPHNLTATNMSARNSLSVDKANNLGYGLGKVIRGAFDYLYHSWQKMWVQEPSAEELAARKKIMVFRHDLREGKNDVENVASKTEQWTKQTVKEAFPLAQPKRSAEQASPFPAYFDLTTLNGTNGFKVEGLSTNDLLGISVSTAGDLNGDGRADLVLGAYGA